MKDAVAPIPSEDELFCRYRDGGDEDAFIELYLRTEAWVFRLCHRILADSDDARDAMQAAWETVLKRRFGFDPKRGKFANMLYTIVKNEALKKLAAKKRFTVLDEDSDVFSQPAVRPSQDGIPADILDGLKRLPQRDQDLIFLHYFAGFSIHDISERFGYHESAIKTWLFRARKVLKPILAPLTTALAWIILNILLT